MIEEPRARFELRWRELRRAAEATTGRGLRPGAWALPLIAFAGGLALALGRPARRTLRGAAVRRRPDA